MSTGHVIYPIPILSPDGVLDFLPAPDHVADAARHVPPTAELLTQEVVPFLIRGAGEMGRYDHVPDEIAQAQCETISPGTLAIMNSNQECFKVTSPGLCRDRQHPSPEDFGWRGVLSRAFFASGSAQLMFSSNMNQMLRQPVSCKFDY